MWTFGDGTYAYGPTPQKTFNVAGRYPVHLAVLDHAGNASQATILVNIGQGQSTLPDPVRNLRIIRPPGVF